MMRVLTWLCVLAGAMLTGCASVPSPVVVGANHPANPNAAAAPVSEPASPLAADLASAGSRAQPQSMPQMHMQGGMKMDDMKMNGMNMKHMDGMHHHGTKQNTHQAGDGQ